MLQFSRQKDVDCSCSSTQPMSWFRKEKSREKNSRSWCQSIRPHNASLIACPPIGRFAPRSSRSLHSALALCTRPDALWFQLMRCKRVSSAPTRPIGGLSGKCRQCERFYFLVRTCVLHCLWTNERNVLTCVFHNVLYVVQRTVVRCTNVQYNSLSWSTVHLHILSYITCD